MEKLKEAKKQGEDLEPPGKKFKDTNNPQHFTFFSHSARPRNTELLKTH